MPEGDYNNYRSSFIQALTKAPTNLFTVFGHHDSSIQTGKYDFNSRNEKAEYVAKITQDSARNSFPKRFSKTLDEF